MVHGGSKQADSGYCRSAAPLSHLSFPAARPGPTPTPTPPPGDARTAADLRVFLLRFLQRFPKYADTPFYISGTYR